MCLEADNFILSFDSRNFSPRGTGVYYRCDCIFKEPWVSDVWISSFPAAQPVSSKLHDGWWAYKDVVQGSFIPGKPFKKEKRTLWEYAECVLSRVMLLRIARYALLYSLRLCVLTYSTWSSRVPMNILFCLIRTFNVRMRCEGDGFYTHQGEKLFNRALHMLHYNLELKLGSSHC